MEYRIDHIGNSQSPVLVIDNVWPDPQELIEQAARKTDYSARSLYYPGLRSAAPPSYARTVTANLTALIQSTFGIAEDLVITDSTFSLVATPFDKLVPFQRVPHFDSVDPRRFALLHYLCGATHGGTAFYRHRSSGLEIISEDVRDNYIRTVNAEVKTVGMPPPRFIEGDTELFERIGSYDAVFNRALVYRGYLLHTVTTPRNFVPDANPRTGRLTLNTFLLAGADNQNPTASQSGTQ